MVGCSILYHLARRGWVDIVLLERAELTAGSTWHAAGGMHTLNGDPNVAALQRYTMELYRELERIEGTACGVHRPGCLYLASTDQEVDFFRVEHAKAQCLGLDLDFVSLVEAGRLNPLLDISFYKAAMFDPNDGHVDPSGVTHAMAKGARDLGATIRRHCAVQSVSRRSDGEWELATTGGTVVAEYVVNAAGLWAREVGALFGQTLPIVPMEHQYILTNDIPALVALGREIPVGVDFSGASYFRQERNGLLLGTYEKDCRHWAKDGTPADFGVELLSPDLDRIATALEKATERLPALADAGIRRVVNGGMVFSPDGNPIIGPLPGLPTAFVAAGCMAGFSQSGGVGLAVSNWIIDGEAGMDVSAMDVARYGTFATTPYVIARTAENYRRRFIIPCPNEELEAARACATSPLYDELHAQGALFGQAAGWEVPLWFAGSRNLAHETPTFRRSNAFEAVRRECHAVRTAAGLWEISSYCKIAVEGPRAAEWLDGIVTNVIPAVGRIALAPMLTPRGRLLGDVTILRTGHTSLLLIGSPAAEPTYIRWLNQHQKPGVSIRSVTNQYCGLSLSGPAARQILAACTDADISSDAFAFMALREFCVGLAPVLAARLSYTGELGYELYMAPGHLRHVYHALHGAGRAFGLRNFGVRALNSLRLEKAYGGWGRELTQDFTPAEAGLERFVRRDKGDFIGRIGARIPEPGRRLTLLRIATDDVDAAGGETLYANGRPLTRLTSAAHSYTGNYGLGLAYLPGDLAPDMELTIDLIGKRYEAQVLSHAPYDPDGLRLRA